MVWGAPLPADQCPPEDRWGEPDPPAEPAPYNLLLRTPRARRWHAFVGLPVLLVTGVLFAVIAYGIAAGVAALIDNPSIVSDTDVEELTGPFGLLVTSVMLAVLIPACLLTVRVVHRERPGRLNSVTRRLRPRLLATSVVLALVVQALSFTVYYLVDAAGVEFDSGSAESAWPGWGTFLAFAVIILCTTPLQAAGEEYLFRGYLIQAAGVWTRSRWIPALLSGLLFAAAHGPQNPWLFADRFLFGMAAWWLTVRTGGLEAAIAAHVVMNMLALTLAAAADEVDATVIATDISAAAGVLDMVTIVVVAWVLDRNARRLRVATHSAVSAT